MQIHVVDSLFRLLEIRFVTIFVIHKELPSTSRVWFLRVLILLVINRVAITNVYGSAFGLQGTPGLAPRVKKN